MINSYLVLFMVNWALNILLVEFLAIRKLKNVINVDEARDSKYPPFRRYDTAWFNRFWLYMCCHLVLVKIIFTFGTIFMCALLCNIFVIGLKPSDPIKGVRYYLIRALFWYTSRIVILNSVSCIWISYERPKVDYSKYLGPDWKPDYDWTTVSSVVSTHCCFLDSILHGMCQLPSIIAKGEVRNVPGVGPIARVAQCFFLDRTSKDDKKRMQDQIIERQKLCESHPNFDPLVIHVEGGTSNGTSIIKFKRGAFVGLRSVWPKIHKFNSFFQSPSTGVVDGLPHYIIGGCSPFSTITKIEMPIFRPNQYLWDHHQREGEEKWETYMRVVRQLMSETSGLPLAEQSIEDKFECKKLLYPGKKV